MSYATQSDLETRYGLRELAAITARPGTPAGEVDSAVVALALADASAVADSYLGVRYSVPLATPAPARLVDLVCQVARYRLQEQRASDRVRQDYTDALAFLRDLAAGRATLPGVQSPAFPGQASGVVGVAAPAPTFTDSVLGAMP